MSIRSFGPQRRRTLFGIILVIAIGVLGAVLYFYFKTTLTERYSAQINELNELIESNTHTVYVAVNDIHAGEMVTADRVVADSIMMENTSELLTSDNLNEVAIVDIKAGSILYKNDVSPEDGSGASDRMTELSCFFLPQSAKEGSYIDVRIRFQTGEDFVVLSKKRVEKLSSSGLTCFLTLSEYEVQRLSSAIIDSRNWEATIYANTYTNPSMQEKSAITYVPGFNTIELLLGMDVIGNAEAAAFSDYRTEFEARIKENDEARKNGTLASIEHTDIRDTSSYQENEIGNTNQQSNDPSTSENFPGLSDNLETN